MRWKIFYDDGSTYSNLDGSWSDAPSYGVQVIAFIDEHGKWVVRHGGDFFKLDEDGAAVNMDLIGMIDFVSNVLGEVKVGRFLSASKFKAIRKTALDFVDEMNGTTIH